MGILDFFSREAGQKRRAALNQLEDDIAYYVPPELRPWLGLLADATPSAAVERASVAGGGLLAPDRTISQRVNDLGTMLSETAQIAAPIMVANRAATPAAEAIQEALLGASIKTNAMSEPVINAGRKAADIANRIEIDPSMVGSMGANLKFKADPLTPAGEVTPYADVEVIDPRDLIGSKISPTPADLTRAGTFYEGIDAAGTARRTPLQGGPLFPLQKQYSDADIAWLVDSASKGSTKLGKDSDFVAVTAMSPQAHQSNASIADAYMGTLEAYIQSGRLPDENVKQLNDIVSNFGKTTIDPELQKLNGFVGFDSPSFNEFMRNATFPQREAISKLMTSPKAMAIGGPNFQKVLDATIQPEFAGSNLGDALLLLELDKKRGLLNLQEEGLPTHMSYDTGLGGRVVGRFENPVSRGLLFPNFEAEYSARPTMMNKSGNIDEARMAYSFGRSLPSEEITPEGARNIFEATQYYNIEQPQQAQLIDQALRGNWKTSSTPKVKGGIAPVDYERALLRNPSLPSLEPYTAKDVKLGQKNKDFKVLQLGKSDVFFGLKKNPDYTWMNDGSPIPGLGDNEIDLVGVISNEIGAKGVASPAIMGKAIEEGASVLNAFAVPSQRFPDGFLPNIYGGYGFEELKRIPFSKEYYIEERGQAAYDDLLKQWRSEGWDESKGFPDVVLMKWRGTDEQRANASQRVFDEGFQGFGSGQAPSIISASREASGSSTLSPSGSKASGSNIGSRDTRPIRSSGRPSKSTGIRSAASELKNLTLEQRKNLGLPRMGLLD